jgi:hypothetical protein
LNDFIGKPLPRNAKPVILTFYDWLRTYPYTAKFYIQEDASEETANELIQVVCSVSECVLGKYTLGYKPFIVPDFNQRLDQMTHTVMGTFKWAIKYRPDTHLGLRTHTIPGMNRDLSIGARIPGLKKRANVPDEEHPLWIKFLEVFKRVCVSEEGYPIPGNDIVLDDTLSKWPPSGAKKGK